MRIRFSLLAIFIIKTSILMLKLGFIPYLPNCLYSYIASKTEKQL